MANFVQPVGLFMSSPVHTIEESASLDEADQRMKSLDVTSLAVVDASKDLVGVVTTTDLIASGLRNAGHRQDAALLEQSGRTVAEVMTPGIISTDIETSLVEAARIMVKQHVHRVFVMANGDLAGVLSARDIMEAVAAVRVNKPVSLFMSSPVFTIRSTETIAMATERLEKAHVTGLIVVDEFEWPVGVFGQREALQSKNMPRSASVETAMDPAVLTLLDTTAIHNVARQAVSMGVRRVAVMNRHELVGVMTALDFAKAIVAPKKPHSEAA